MEFEIWHAIFAIFLIIALFSYLTNPFVRFTLIKDPFKDFNLKSKKISQAHKIHVRKMRIYKYLALIKAGWHIVYGSLIVKKKAQGHKLDHIIKNIHKLRFNPNKPFLISGDHFSVLYIRSLGIFYHSLLDPRIPSDATDWLNRQLIYAKTLAFALNVFEQAKRLSTTIVPIARSSVVLVNIYAYPSDTLYSLLLGIKNLLGKENGFKTYPFKSESVNMLETQEYGKLILKKYSKSLKQHFITYSEYVFDKKSGLIKKNILLSSTKDIAKRHSSFYDNVIYWKTFLMLQDLGILPKDLKSLKNLKEDIVEKFWCKNKGYFLEDQSEKGTLEKWYSSDWLIAYQAGFLTPESKKELSYLKKSVDYVIKNKLDMPFPICYHKEKRPFQLHLPVRIGAPLYGSRVIWSHWGVEYIKLLLHVYLKTAEKKYFLRAQKFIRIYKNNIIQTKGFPEVYGPEGKPYKHRLYKSVHQTGWVINFEQAVAMYDFVNEEYIKKGARERT